KDAPSGDIPDWLAAPALESPSSLTAVEDEPAELKDAPSGDIPDWLAAPALESPSSLTAVEDEPAELKDAPSRDIPDWLAAPALDSLSSTAVEDESVALEEDAPFSGITDRLEAVALQSPPSFTAVEDEHVELEGVPGSVVSDEVEAAALPSPIHPESEAKPIEPVQDADTLGWLETFKAVSANQSETPIVQADFTFPDFTEDFQASDNMDELFTELPDGLLSDSEVPPPMPTEDIDSEAIAPDDLPAWVEAMRPLDSGISQLSSTASLSGTDQIIEESGALAGLQGVLPAGLGFAPMSKPKVYPIRVAGRDEQQAHAGLLEQMQTVESAPVPTVSYKLQASDEQQAHAALLEQIISAEAAPVPMASFSVLRTSRSLRWFLALIIFGTIALPLSMRTQMFSLPVGIPLDVNGALQVAQSIPESAPVLVAFDYEPARAGEMEAAAAPMFDQMILLRHPHLTFISTNETGAILVERFLAGPLAAHNYQSGIQYVNLGYLPGGQMGIRAFGQKPQVTAPFDLSLSSAWQSAPLAGVSALSQFAALIVVTDDADAARTWIEQTQSVRGGIPFVVISSAQAAPMIQPYYESQQISGLVPGLYGGALFEQYNAGRPGTARLYWDAFSLGMLLAMSVVFGGGLWSLTLGLRDRRAAGEAA
ncbi:MAG: hypothetical protein Q7J80_09070, partial [Anaerolineales bacterium]|nr:hypothetical protein [Anaerolineales bacterium]